MHCEPVAWGPALERAGSSVHVSQKVKKTKQKKQKTIKQAVWLPDDAMGGFFFFLILFFCRSAHKVEALTFVQANQEREGPLRSGIDNKININN